MTEVATKSGKQVLEEQARIHTAVVSTKEFKKNWKKKKGEVEEKKAEAAKAAAAKGRGRGRVQAQYVAPCPSSPMA